MAKLKKGEVLTCEVCGLVVVVDESCGCAVGEIICCKKKPMVKGKAAADKAKKLKAVAKTTAKSAAAKAAKNATKAKAAVKKAGKKPAAKAKKK